MDGKRPNKRTNTGNNHSTGGRKGKKRKADPPPLPPADPPNNDGPRYKTPKRRKTANEALEPHRKQEPAIQGRKRKTQTSMPPPAEKNEAWRYGVSSVRTRSQTRIENETRAIETKRPLPPPANPPNNEGRQHSVSGVRTRRKALQIERERALRTWNNLYLEPSSSQAQMPPSAPRSHGIDSMISNQTWHIDRNQMPSTRSPSQAIGLGRADAIKLEPEISQSDDKYNPQFIPNILDTILPFSRRTKPSPASSEHLVNQRIPVYSPVTWYVNKDLPLDKEPYVPTPFRVQTSSTPPGQTDWDSFILNQIQRPGEKQREYQNQMLDTHNPSIPSAFQRARSSSTSPHSLSLAAIIENQMQRLGQNRRKYMSPTYSPLQARQADRQFILNDFKGPSRNYKIINFTPSNPLRMTLKWQKEPETETDTDTDTEMK